MSAFDTLVVPVDFSRPSDAALRLAHALATQFQSRVHLLHVLPDPLHLPWAAESPDTDFPALLRVWTEDARRRLIDFAAKAQFDPCRITTAVLVGLPQIRIVEYADEHNADLILMGRHGHTSRDLVLLGSVADQVLRRARCPVMTVPFARAGTRTETVTVVNRELRSSASTTESLNTPSQPVAGS